MNKRLVAPLVLLVAVRCFAMADEPTQKDAPQSIKAQQESQFDSDLPKVLLWGDSISGGYLPFVIERLKGKAVVVRKSSGTTRNALVGLDRFLAERKWDVIHFNNGLHDLCQRHPAITC